MVVCRYYGTPKGCKYGNNCKFEHIDPPNGANNKGLPDPFNSKPQQRHENHSRNVNHDSLRWPLSCIANTADVTRGNVLNGDVSPEELRLQAYEMAPRGASAEVHQREGQLVSEHRAKMDALSRGGTQMSQRNANSFRNQAPVQAKDPFASNGGQQNQGFGGGFGAQQNNPAYPNGVQIQNPFQQQQQNMGSQVPMNVNPTGFSAPNPQQNLFGQSQPQGHQEHMSMESPAPVANASHDAQFSAQQFGFAKVPEAAPPPRYF